MSMEEERRGRLFVPPAFTMAASVCTVHLVYPGSRTELRSESQIEPERRATQRGLGPRPKIGARLAFKTISEMAEFVRAGEAAGFVFEGKQYLVGKT